MAVRSGPHVPIEDFFYIGSSASRAEQNLTSCRKKWKARENISRRKWSWISLTLRKWKDNITKHVLTWYPSGKHRHESQRHTWRRELYLGWVWSIIRPDRFCCVGRISPVEHVDCLIDNNVDSQHFFWLLQWCFLQIPLCDCVITLWCSFCGLYSDWHLYQISVIWLQMLVCEMEHQRKGRARSERIPSRNVISTFESQYDVKCILFFFFFLTEVFWGGFNLRDPHFLQKGLEMTLSNEIREIMTELWISYVP